MLILVGHPATINPLLFGFLYAFLLATAAICIVFSGDGREHIKHHAIDGRQHTPCKFIATVGH